MGLVQLGVVQLGVVQMGVDCPPGSHTMTEREISGVMTQVFVLDPM